MPSNYHDDDDEGEDQNYHKKETNNYTDEDKDINLGHNLTKVALQIIAHLYKSNAIMTFHDELSYMMTLMMIFTI